MSFHSSRFSELSGLFGTGSGREVLAGPAYVRPPDPHAPATPLATALPERAAPPVPQIVPEGFYIRHGKRAVDVVLGTLALVLSLPVLVLLVAMLWIEGGNPFYSQLRLGRDGRHFRMFKLRTMVTNAEEMLESCLAADPAMRCEWDTTQKLKRDPRVTPLGRLVRKLSLDELPQIFNVLRGDMSLVGPRPMLPEQLPLYLYPDAYLPLRPGLTGLWQVTARNEQSFELRAQLDQRYFVRLSPLTDLRIMLATVGAVMRGTGY